jgi:hypothetical protein
MEGESLKTTNQEIIKKWVEDRGGLPSVVKSANDNDEGGLLRIDFPGYTGKDTLTPISWDEFFAIFESRQLAFLYQDKTSSGETSRFFKFVHRSDK